MWGLGGGVKKNLGLGGLTNLRTERGRELASFWGEGRGDFCWYWGQFPITCHGGKACWILLNNQLFQRKSNQPGFNISGWNN